MYGTIFSMKVKSGHHEQLLKVLQEREQETRFFMLWEG